MSPYRTDARLSGRHPFEIFLLVFSFIVGLPTVFGIEPRPGSIQEAFPDWAGFMWSIALTLGPAIALVGVYLRNRGSGLILEQLGLAIMGAACVAYGFVGLLIVPLSRVPAGIILGFGVACLWRYRDIQSVLHSANAEVDRRRNL